MKFHHLDHHQASWRACMLPQWEDCMLATRFHWDLLCCFMLSISLSLSLWVFLSFYPLCAESLTWHIPWRPGVLKLNQASWISNSKAFNQASTPGSCRRAFIAFNVIMFVTSVTSVAAYVFAIALPEDFRSGCLMFNAKTSLNSSSTVSSTKGACAIHCGSSELRSYCSHWCPGICHRIFKI